MDNADIVNHLASTAQAYDASAEVVESFIRSYYRDMRDVTKKWYGRDEEGFHDVAFSEINAVYQRYWLGGTRFTDYWQPALGPPADFDIAGDGGVTIYQDMLGSFVVIVCANERECAYLLSVVRDQLRIVNRFF